MPEEYGKYASHATAHLPHDFLTLLRHSCRMEQIDILIDRIAQRLSELGISERTASLEATGKPDAIRYIRMRRAMPAAPRLASIARVLSATPEFLLGQADENKYFAIDDVDWRRSSEPDFDLDEVRRRSQQKPTLGGHNHSYELNPMGPGYSAYPVPVLFCANDYFAEYSEEKDPMDRIIIDRDRVITQLNHVPVGEGQEDTTYCIYLPTGCMHPALPAGEPILINSALTPDVHDLALFYLVSKRSYATKGEIAIPGYIRDMSDDGFEVDQFQGGRRLILKDEISHVDRIFTMSDFLR